MLAHLSSHNQVVSMKKIPVTIITGFLGAGKTTLVRHVLENAGNKRIALIINEFGDVGVDGELLKGCGDENCQEDGVNDIVELANGCICCTVADEFIPTMEAILARENLPDHIIIETSGLALPQPLVRAFNWPQIKTQVSIDGVISVVDALALSEGRFAANEIALNEQREQNKMLDHSTALGELFEDQLICADLIVINKIDLVEAEQLKKIETLINKETRKGTGIIKAANGIVDVSALLGMGLESENNLMGRESHHEKHHAAGLDHHHDHDDFISFSLILPPSKSKNELIALIKKIIVEHDILRLKGFAAIEGSNARLVIQAVGLRVNSWFDRAWQEGEKRETSLVIIGQAGLDEAAIRQSFLAGA